MAFYPLQVAGLVLGVLGLAGALATTLLPQWRVSAFVGSNIIVFERIWEGLWMTCVRQARTTLQCKLYSSLLALSLFLLLPPVLEAARALGCVAVALALTALLVGICGLRQVQCTGSDERAKAYFVGASGALLLLAGLFVLIPVSWTAHIVIRDFHNPAVHVGQKRELGAALFLGWASAALLLAGGAGEGCLTLQLRGCKARPVLALNIPPSGCSVDGMESWSKEIPFSTRAVAVTMTVLPTEGGWGHLLSQRHDPP
ncbi:PREDICTED: claudin-17 [Myotis davidii]|uniref:claudin-17 n=1 Tax=Myotis davidii TaxID=225400 RepID=UPI000767CE6D|nr:PREDICTED: claudin-17 [Myotis davidii]